jgi:hypothetical protein
MKNLPHSYVDYLASMMFTNERHNITSTFVPTTSSITTAESSTTKIQQLKMTTNAAAFAVTTPILLLKRVIVDMFIYYDNHWS